MGSNKLILINLYYVMYPLPVTGTGAMVIRSVTGQVTDWSKSKTIG